MYKPRQSNPPMIGGDYISSPTIESSPDVSLSTLYYIMSIANITSLQAITTLTEHELSTMTVEIDKQISKDKKDIIDNDAEIARLSIEITKLPDGLQAQYNNEDHAYQQALGSYQHISSLILQDEQNLAYDISSLKNLYQLSTIYVSTSEAYELEYEAILAKLRSYESTVDLYAVYYQNDLLSISTNNILYKGALADMSTISSITAMNYSTLYNSNPPPPPQEASTLLTIYGYGLMNYFNASTQVVSYLISNSIFEASLAYNFSVLSSILGISTFVMIHGNTYASTIAYYERLASDNSDIIARYNADIIRYTQEISTITNQNSILLTDLDADISLVRTTADEFYPFLKAALESECDEYIYAIQEYNSQVAFIVASLGIAINNNYTRIDSNTYDSLANGSPVSTENTTLESDNRSMDTIINGINSLDSLFSSIIDDVVEEKRLKRLFIDLRKDICKDYEAPALKWTQLQLDQKQQEYLGKFGTLDDYVISINARIGTRNGTLTQINNIINAQRTSINLYFERYLVREDQLPDNLTQIKDENGNPLGMRNNMSPEPSDHLSNSQYALIPPINFNLGS